MAEVEPRHKLQCERDQTQAALGEATCGMERHLIKDMSASSRQLFESVLRDRLLRLITAELPLVAEQVSTD